MTTKEIQKVIRAFAIVCVAAGGFGMALCAPYLLATNWIIVIAAGIPLVAGAVLVTGGLFTITYLIKD